MSPRRNTTLLDPGFVFTARQHMHTALCAIARPLRLCEYLMPQKTFSIRHKQLVDHLLRECTMIRDNVFYSACFYAVGLADIHCIISCICSLG